MTGEEVLKLQTIFRNRELELSDVINKSMEIISEITTYTSIVLGTSSSINKLKRVEVVPINDNTVIAIVITDKGNVENKTITLSTSISIEEIKKTVDLNKIVKKVKVIWLVWRNGRSVRTRGVYEIKLN